ncbi:ABC transporter ATP-binding protein/permease, partial [bacterium]|nr:ABC transporter ATP-binding protein/permease [bacterium]
GKTTLVNCLNKYLEVEEGHIFLSGTDITKIPYPDLRSVIRTVSQDAFLFSDSIKKNIIFGSTNEDSVPLSKLDTIVHESALRNDIERFPKKIDTIIGEKGIMLSGGQKQRIALARAMIAPFDLLILDNILSAVDHETEHFLLSNILKRKTSRSLLIVSNRVQALEHADMIIVLNKGTVSELGTHTELINRSGLYQETWKLQNQNQ